MLIEKSRYTEVTGFAQHDSRLVAEPRFEPRQLSLEY